MSYVGRQRYHKVFLTIRAGNWLGMSAIAAQQLIICSQSVYERGEGRIKEKQQVGMKYRILLLPWPYKRGTIDAGDADLASDLGAALELYTTLSHGACRVTRTLRITYLR